MNQRIKNQLQKIKSVELNYTDTTTKIFIPKTIEIRNESLNVGKVYLIEISDEILSPPAGSTLASNWNGGKIPNHKEYFAELVKVINNMYQWNCTAKDNPSDSFFGYIPSSGFKIKEVLE